MLSDVSFKKCNRSLLIFVVSEVRCKEIAFSSGPSFCFVYNDEKERKQTAGMMMVMGMMMGMIDDDDDEIQTKEW